MLFLAGIDWGYLALNGLEELPNPRIKLVQHVRHAHEGTELHGYLSMRAIRVCVSQEVADAITATGRTNGPVLTIPNGTEVAPFEPDAEGTPAGYEDRRRSIAIVGYKRPDLARALSERLDAVRIEHAAPHGIPRPKRVPRSAGGDPDRGLPAVAGRGLLSSRSRGDSIGMPRGDPGLHRQSRLLPPRPELSGRRARAPMPSSERRSGRSP